MNRNELESIRESDPILYSELTSDPTGGGSESGFGSTVVIVLIIVGILIYNLI